MPMQKIGSFKKKTGQRVKSPKSMKEKHLQIPNKGKQLGFVPIKENNDHGEFLENTEFYKA